jgi:hypothetical protein
MDGTEAVADVSLSGSDPINWILTCKTHGVDQHTVRLDERAAHNAA